jgi:peptidoglycan/LPS O-acetylase OafA/YrhL
MPHAFRSLDLFRFLAAVMVLIGHYTSEFQLGLEGRSWIVSRFSLFVDFFFILSGFVIALTYGGRIANGRTYGAFLWRRFARLWPLHALTLAGMGMLALLASGAGYVFNKPELFQVADLPWNLALLHAWGPVWHFSFNGVSWSISAELFVYMLFPLFAWLAARLPITLLLTLVGAYVAALASLRGLAGLEPWHEATYDLGMLRAVPSFMLGVIIHKAMMRPAWRVEASWPMAASVAALALVAMHIGLPSELVILLFAAFVWLAALAETAHGAGALGTRFSQMLGDASYGLYMLHVPVMSVMLFIIRRTTGFEGPWPWLFALASLAISLAAAILLFRLFERPARDWLNARSPFERRRFRQPRTAE